ncbi:hypothetical protein FRX31_034932 [Thalictrum thalictroides]|uniref:Uncharacterized protein n=1 Tax=Thalictrum thalictroides TaxID=46969 RepID=A0A7J6USR2_THATH|nr:hypothetical protein FRX31_034932 [Thalictrum thalictroides]
MGVYMWNPTSDECTLLPSFWVPNLEWGYVLGTDGSFGLGYDETDNEYQILSILDSFSDDRSTVSVLFGTLCVLCHDGFNSNFLEAWIMEHYGDKNSWVWLFRKSLERCPLCVGSSPLYLMNNGAEILLCDKSGFYVYDSRDEDEALKVCVINNLSDGSFQGITF